MKNIIIVFIFSSILLFNNLYGQYECKFEKSYESGGKVFNCYSIKISDNNLSEQEKYTIVELNSTGQYRISHNTGKTWNPYNPSLEKEQQVNFTIYPNPVKNNLLNLKVNCKHQSIQSIRITDVSGDIVNTYKIIENSLKTIDLSKFKQGVYYIKISKFNGISTSKMFVIE